ncbi:NADP-dependent phosphogluconate dehydrogenase [Loigolactobacillus coryniformis]|jgi:6-phosphogluconate dehydrogenase|uniref:6-phosphogluconate dehydrogenase, decarboxylating n=1 Tax=Loigolactobacillus coryniformis subsp. coryniformis KCTC 3167 = DSM 20001 TaxID=913848 RepID=A0A0R1F0Q3_9LACO|nr:NADP-dependent phosphogluconate dehydrogenase [Loigolactobacillus coryniformis]OEH89372.1 6-phosphogluconate dehydrogenase [Loigolactobacillus coryniformis subsp. coryniformis]ATO55714.1 phosphogluconate dehydrogenase (NADP(+)-dependent, decarboxylating) [Loigolactobacillus coryniformis subsp. coryniformis KCTC 3167 = DSM 20001]KRK15403.1 6-phosphogluconate dehydrogenase [Loigolactobacillus coryniformis subsp. coryniformis KCTC 3167 = DSM 20001]MBW4802726.1 NADP-dependent phosphogluconate de
MEKQTPQIGVVGMAVMGKNLALNIESRGYTVAIYNRTSSKTETVAKEHADKKLVPSYSIQDFVASLEKPRRIILMVKAGAGTDAVIQELLPLLDKGDVLIDGGNTFFKDTMRRNAELDKSGINFIGMGVSGGELGALQGPSMMPGGQKEAYDLVAPIFEQMAAKATDGAPCVTYIGPNGAGHYVKMIHNGIEYGDEELIAESYHVLHELVGLSVDEIAAIFDDWNKGELDSYLIDITADILTRKDDLGTGKPIVDVILDRTANKGTGKWSSANALELEIPQSLITESVYARYISMMKDERVKASKVLPKPVGKVDFDKTEVVEMIRKALYFSKIMSYAQGFEQMRIASDHYDWNLDYANIARIWRAGCIIRAQFLQNITDAYEKDPQLQNLMLDDYFLNITKQYQESVRDLVGLAVKAGVPVPGFAAAISYFDSYRSERLPANIIQAERDYFGAHTYERTDREGSFHYPWYEEQ